MKKNYTAAGTLLFFFRALNGLILYSKSLDYQTQIGI